ncbi:hypothetical protein KP509_26G019200 [Ceratopteris richardii]|uniref:SAC domain-containing protein n=1 Tax=Ceratopteris richardii TaxID=49495 RepID=A0A8T2RLC8_CERRI|nr:hypothetical protein KP509_26G019200 [Ceratopteris richardii]
MDKCSSKSKRPVESNGFTHRNSYSLQEFNVYETLTNFYIIGRDTTGLRWRVLKVDRTEASALNIYEDPTIYSKKEINDLLTTLREGNRASGGLKFVINAYGIIGFVKFLEPYYMILITKRRFLGDICGHTVYGIAGTLLLTVPHPSVSSKLAKLDAENSYTYRVMWNLQTNVRSCQHDVLPQGDMYVWNSFLSREFRSQVRTSHWTVDLVYGFFKQVKLSSESTRLTLTLIARRSRHFAGTRYRRRGINFRGRVANDVEVEQLVCDDDCEDLVKISSVVQHRGSIPVFWSQETSIFSPKPEIMLHSQKDPNYGATRLHFEDLVRRYDNPIIVLNLVKRGDSRERILANAFATSIAYLNHSLPSDRRIRFIQMDMHMFSRRFSANVLEILNRRASDLLDIIGFFHCTNLPRCFDERSFGHPPNNTMEQGGGLDCSLQKGVLRTNCIDCLDRTNLAQYAIGLAALGRQIESLGLSPVPRAGSTLAATLMGVYEKMGDVLAIQYGGSPAHNKIFPQVQGKWKALIEYEEMCRSIQRFYNNAYRDHGKQDAINVFLGNFRPQLDGLDLLELNSENNFQGSSTVHERSNSRSITDFGRRGLESMRSISFDELFEQTDFSVSSSSSSSSSKQPLSMGVSTLRSTSSREFSEMRKDFEALEGSKTFASSLEDLNVRALTHADSWMENCITPDSSQHSNPGEGTSEETNSIDQDLMTRLLSNKDYWKRGGDEGESSHDGLSGQCALRELDVDSGMTISRLGFARQDDFLKKCVDMLCV